jgi:DNA-binding NarL/FixJ family response regulator
MRLDHNAGSSVNVLVADAKRIGRELMVHALDGHPKINVVSSVSSLSEALGATQRSEVHVALVSGKVQDGLLNGFELVRQMRHYSPNTRAVMLLEENAPDLVVNAFRVGARGIFTHEKWGLEMLYKCVLTVHQGHVWADKSELTALLDAFYNTTALCVTDARGINLLSKREEQVVILVSEGMSNREIARKLELSEHTVKNHLFRVFERLGISSRVELVSYVLSSSKRAAGDELTATLAGAA